MRSPRTVWTPCSTTSVDRGWWTRGGCFVGRDAGLLRLGVHAKGTGHRLRPYLPIFARILLWSVLPNGKRATFYFVKRWPKLFREDLSTVFSLLAEGKIKARVDRRLPLERAAEALGLLASGKASGKVLLVPELRAE